MTQKKKRIIKVVDIVDSPKKNNGNRPHITIEKEVPSWDKHEEKDLEIPRIERDEGDHIIDRTFDFDAEQPTEKKERISGKKKILMGFIGIVILALFWYLGAYAFPKVDVRITAKKVSWEFVDPIAVHTDISKTQDSLRSIPGEIISQSKSGVFSFPATGEKHVERKAQGTLIIYNEYSSAPQALVATTRFQTPDGKIYRLIDQVTVPGAKVAGGKIERAGIEAKVIADAPGPEYNIGMIDRFNIPGFSGSDKFEGFYASSKTAVEGGFIGVTAYPVDEDIENAKQQARQDITNALKGDISSQIPQGLTIVPGAEKIDIAKEEVNTQTNEQKEFSIAIEGVVSLFAFQEKDALDMLERLSMKASEVSAEEYKRINYTLTYESPSVDWEKKTMTLPIQYSDTLARKIDAEHIQQEIAGKKEVDVKTFILSVPGVDKLTVSFWPFWVKTVPEKASRVNVTIE